MFAQVKIQSLDSEDRLPKVKSLLCYLQILLLGSVWSLSLSFLQMETITGPTYRVIKWNEMIYIYKALRILPGSQAHYKCWLLALQALVKQQKHVFNSNLKPFISCALNKRLIRKLHKLQPPLPHFVQESCLIPL